MGTALIGETTIGYDDEGSGDPLVLVHGHPFDRSMWRPQVEHFSRIGWRVIAPDLRGYGETTTVPGKTTLETFARDVVGLLDHLEVERFVLGGLSMGGQIVMEIYRLFPHRVRGLLLAATAATAETAHGGQQRRELANRLLREGLEPYAAEVLPMMVAPRNIEAIPTVAEQVLTMMRSTSPEGAAAALRGRAERRDYVDTLRDATVPCLVVVGSDDEFTPPDDARLIADLVTDATLEIIDGTAHLPNLERPTEFNMALQRFLDSLPAPAMEGQI